MSSAYSAAPKLRRAVLVPTARPFAVIGLSIAGVAVAGALAASAMRALSKLTASKPKANTGNTVGATAGYIKTASANVETTAPAPKDPAADAAEPPLSAEIKSTASSLISSLVSALASLDVDAVRASMDALTNSQRPEEPEEPHQAMEATGPASGQQSLRVSQASALDTAGGAGAGAGAPGASLSSIGSVKVVAAAAADALNGGANAQQQLGEEQEGPEAEDPAVDGAAEPPLSAEMKSTASSLITSVVSALASVDVDAVRAAVDALTNSQRPEEPEEPHQAMEATGPANGQQSLRVSQASALGTAGGADAGAGGPGASLSSIGSVKVVAAAAADALSGGANAQQQLEEGQAGPEAEDVLAAADAGGLTTADVAEAGKLWPLATLNSTKSVHSVKSPLSSLGVREAEPVTAALGTWYQPEQQPQPDLEAIPAPGAGQAAVVGVGSRGTSLSSISSVKPAAVTRGDGTTNPDEAAVVRSELLRSGKDEVAAADDDADADAVAGASTPTAGGTDDDAAKPLEPLSSIKSVASIASAKLTAAALKSPMCSVDSARDAAIRIIKSAVVVTTAGDHPHRQSAGVVATA